jgi:hypothetical protein
VTARGAGGERHRGDQEADRAEPLRREQQRVAGDHRSLRRRRRAALERRREVHPQEPEHHERDPDQHPRHSLAPALRGVGGTTVAADRAQRDQQRAEGAQDQREPHVQRTLGRPGEQVQEEHQAETGEREQEQPLREEQVLQQPAADEAPVDEVGDEQCDAGVDRAEHQVQ